MQFWLFKYLPHRPALNIPHRQPPAVVAAAEGGCITHLPKFWLLETRTGVCVTASLSLPLHTPRLVGADVCGCVGKFPAGLGVPVGPDAEVGANVPVWETRTDMYTDISPPMHIDVCLHLCIQGGL